MNVMLESHSRSENKSLSNSEGNLEALDVLFSRYRRVLSLVAYRVLGNHKQAEDAVQNCLRSASENPPRFKHEGVFRSWLVRVLIDEAVSILNKQKSAGRGSVESVITRTRSSLMSSHTRYQAFPHLVD